MMSVKELREWLNQFEDDDRVIAAESYDGGGFIEIFTQDDKCVASVEVC